MGMDGTELHAKACVWEENSGVRIAVLVMEGEAIDWVNGGSVAADALYRATLARGLHLTTDLDHRDRRPLRGWQVRVDEDRTVTIDWPRLRPLVDHAPLELPRGWLRTAIMAGRVELVVGYGLGLRDDTYGGLARVERAAEIGSVASGTLTLSCTLSGEVDVPAQRVAEQRQLTTVH
jgi:hypothetical protein